MLDTTFLRFIAILLITNSHLDNLYPAAAMSIGGQLGNSLFFMLSGFGLVTSFRKKGDAFLPWLHRRLSRIYPSVLLVAMSAAVISGVAFEWYAMDFVHYLLWPTEYWFIAAIVCFYPPFYWLMRHKNRTVFLQVATLLFVPYFYFYSTMLDLSHFSIEEGGYFKWIFYFQVMLLGGYLAMRNEAVKPVLSTGWNIALLGLFLIAYFAMKLVIARGMMTEYQFLIHWLTFPIVVFSLYAMNADVVKEIIMKSAVSPLIAMVAGATLEIYLFQKYVYGNTFILSLPFPLNITVFWPVVIAGAILIAWVSMKGSRYVFTRLQPFAIALSGRGSK